MVTQSYDDLYDLAQREPLWWDEHRVPRFAPFHPTDVNNIYATEVALCEISCQECSRKFLVAESTYMMDLYEEALRYIVACALCDKNIKTIDKEELNQKVIEECNNREMSKRLQDGWVITGGDPPFHGYWANEEPEVLSTREKLERQNHPPCSAGYCMGSDPIRVVEFWVHEKCEWIRRPELEKPFELDDSPRGPSSVTGAGLD
jgi:hypothetical protein